MTKDQVAQLTGEDIQDLASVLATFDVLFEISYQDNIEAEDMHKAISNAVDGLDYLAYVVDDDEKLGVALERVKD